MRLIADKPMSSHAAVALETNYIEQSTMAIDPNMDVAAAATTETPNYLVTSITCRSNTSLVRTACVTPRSATLVKSLGISPQPSPPAASVISTQSSPKRSVRLSLRFWSWRLFLAYSRNAFVALVNTAEIEPHSLGEQINTVLTGSPDFP